MIDRVTDKDSCDSDHADTDGTSGDEITDKVTDKDFQTPVFASLTQIVPPLVRFGPSRESRFAVNMAAISLD